MRNAMRLGFKRGGGARLGLLVIAWTIYGLLSTWQTHYWYSFSQPMSWWDSARYEMSYGYLWCACTPAILWLARRYRLERHRVLPSLAVHLAAMTLFIVATKTIFDALTNPPGSAFTHFTWQKLTRSIESTADTAALIYMVILLIEHSIAYYREYQCGVVHSSRLQAQLAKAQLQALKMQLHPHFLFNTLHTISELVHEDPEMAERTIARLSELLRLFLATSMIHEVPLSEELRILFLYIDIEKTRFEDRLSVVQDVPSELLDAMVPNLVLQPLVENAIRHGLGKRMQPGTVWISAERCGDTVLIRVRDDGAGLGPTVRSVASQGMGLMITRNRLESLYGAEHSMVLQNVPGGGAEVRIAIPFRSYQKIGWEEQSVTVQGGHR